MIQGKSINGRVIRKAIDGELKGNELNFSKKMFKPGENYTNAEIINGVKLGKFYSECQYAGENDLLIMLPDLKLFMCIEVKHHMKKDESKIVNAKAQNTPGRKNQSQTKNNIDSNLRKAAAQLKKNAKFIALMHGAILSEIWRFIKVAAISPHVYNMEKICKNCRKFILTTETLKQKGGLMKWWVDMGLFEGNTKIDQNTKDQGYSEFQLFFHRLVNLSATRIVPGPFDTWSQVEGNNTYHMSGGYTTTTARGAVSVEDALPIAHNAYKVLYFNRDQQSLLTNNALRYVLFFCDFGSGRKPTIL